MDPSTTSNSELFRLSPPSELLGQCPKFNILVLGSPEATKVEIFSRLFGVDLEKVFVQNAFTSSHDIESELDLGGQNDRLAIYTSRNFGTGDERTYRSVADFVRRRGASPDLATHIHCIWYCVASDEARPIHPLEPAFLVAANAPVVIVFTKYDEFVARVHRRWESDCQERGLSDAAVLHVLRDLTAERFQETIGSRWDHAIGAEKRQLVPRECVTADDDSSFERLAAATLASARDRRVKLAFVAAQRNSVWMATQFCAAVASEYFIVDTGHARKVDGIDMRDNLANFFAKGLELFNLHCEPADALQDPALAARVLEAVLDSAKLPFLDLDRRAEATVLAAGLSPHERACLLAQALAATLWFFHRLADTQWLPRRSEVVAAGTHVQSTPAGPRTNHALATRQAVKRALEDMARAKRERAALLETVETSAIFTQCRLRSEVADLLLQAVERAERGPEDARGSRIRADGARARDPPMAMDDWELEQLSFSSVTHGGTGGTDDVVLPGGLRILPLN